MKRLTFVLVLFFAACSDPICGCSEPMPTGIVVVVGVVVDATAAPLEGAEVSPVGSVLFQCSIETTLVSGEPSPAVTDAAGGFELMVFVVDGPGDHCFDLAVSSPTTGATDTVSAIPGSFRDASREPLDTVEVTLTVTW